MSEVNEVYMDIKSEQDFEAKVRNIPTLITVEELVTNALDAAINSQSLPKLIDIRIVKGSDYPFLDEPDTLYLMVLNSGHPIASMHDLLRNGGSSHGGCNNVYGLGFLYPVAKLSGGKFRGFYVLTKKKDGGWRWVKGPYGPRVRYGEESGDWPLPEEYVTGVFIPIHKKKELKKLQQSFTNGSALQEFSNKYALALWKWNREAEILSITLEGQKVVSRIPKDATCTVLPAIHSDELDADIIFYRFVVKDGAETSQGFYAASAGVTIERLGTRKVVKKFSQKIWKSPEDGLKEHGDMNSLETYVDVIPHFGEDGNETWEDCLMSDKREFDKSSDGFAVLRDIINDADGDRYREARAKDVEATLEAVIASFLYKTLASEGWFVIRQARLPKALSEKDKIPDILVIRPKNPSKALLKKAEKALQSGSGVIKNYRCNIDDLAGEDMIQVYEIKRPGVTFEAYHFGQLLGYCNWMKAVCGVNPERIEPHFVCTSYNKYDYDDAQETVLLKKYRQMVFNDALQQLEE